MTSSFGTCHMKTRYQISRKLEDSHTFYYPINNLKNNILKILKINNKIKLWKMTF